MAAKKNYNKISTEKSTEEKVDIVETAEEAIAETVAEAVESEPSIVYGKIANCTKLNIRKKPNIKSDILTVIDTKAVVEIYPDNSPKGWYKVIVSKGIEGYCMKEFIKLDK